MGKKRSLGWNPGCLLLFALLAASSARADTAGRFDYWLLALSWSPQYCATSTRDEPQQCGPSRHYGFVVHGLWPQNERGFPKRCQQSARVPDSLVDRMLPLMPSPGLIQHEWREHGVCSGLSAKDYFARIDRLWSGLKIPARYTAPDQPIRIKPAQLEDDFTRINPDLRADGIALQCSGQYLRELRICFDRQLRPRACSTEVRDRCGSSVLLRPAASA